MQAFQLCTLEEELSRRQRAIREIDDRLAQQLARQAVLQQLYEGSSLSPSQNSSSFLNQSSISQVQSSAVSISSSFLRQQIREVYSFMRERKAEKQMNNTLTKTHLIDPHIHTSLYAQTTHLKQQDRPEEISSQVDKRKKDHNAMLQFIHNQQARMKRQQQQEERKRQILQFLNAQQRIRQQSLKQERLKIRQQLLKQENNYKQNISLDKINKNIIIHSSNQMLNNDTLKKQRTTALSRLLKQVKNGQKKAIKLMERTRIASYH